MAEESRLHILSFRVTEQLQNKFTEFCNERKMRPAQALRAMFESALNSDTVNVSANDVTMTAVRENFTDEEVIAYIFEYRVLKNNISDIADHLFKNKGIPKSFVYHCYGKMILAGVNF